MPTRHLLPRAGIDQIGGAGPALAMFALLVERPARFQTIALLLDESHRGLGALVVERTVRPDSVLDVAHLLADAAPNHPRLRAVVLASVRPGRTPATTALDDVDRWADLDELLSGAGLELVEWFVLGDDPPVSCPRDLLGAPPRW